MTQQETDYTAKSIVREFDEIISSVFGRNTNEFLDPRILHTAAKECASLCMEKIIVEMENNLQDQQRINELKQINNNISKLKS